MLVRVTEEMDEVLEDFNKLVNDKSDDNDIQKLIRVEKACHTILNGVYKQWKGANYRG